MKTSLKYLAVGALLAAALVDNANAIPSFARQTGLNCSACHTVFPELTQVGRDYKLHGYTMGGGESTLASKLAVMVQLDSIEHKAGQPGDKAINFSQGSIFFGGKIVKNIGAFGQFTYENGDDENGAVFGVDLLDIRYANTKDINGKELVYGVTVNNNLGVQDIWNTVGSWAYPYAGGLGIGATLFDPDMAPPVGGVGVYAMWDNLLYAEVSAYRGSKGTGLMQFFSWNTKAWDPATAYMDQTSPYVRLAIQHNVGANYFMLGGSGFWSKINPDPTAGSVLTKYKDKSLDAEWQYDSGVNLITANASKVWETQTLSGNDTKSDTTRLKLSYYYDHTYGATVNYVTSTNTDSTADATGIVYELDYMPTQKIKLAAQYNTYSKFGGTTTGASDNNNIYLNVWFMF